MKYCYVLFFLSALLLHSCSPSRKVTVKKFRSLQRPEKIWIYGHPFSAVKAFKTSSRAVELTQKIKEEHLLDQRENGGQLDAFRHSLWMALLTKQIGPRKAEKLGKAHEKGNYLDFRKGRLEEGEIPDSASTVMDLYNNLVGIQIGCENYKVSEDSIKVLILDAIRKGRMKIIARKNNGDFVDCEGRVIPAEELRGKWVNRKCLVNSDTITKD